MLSEKSLREKRGYSVSPTHAWITKARIEKEIRRSTFMCNKCINTTTPPLSFKYTLVVISKRSNWCLANQACKLPIETLNYKEF